MKKAVVIIPTYNERENIQKVLPKLLTVFSKISGWKLMILVVDDNSPDKTHEVVTQISAQQPAVKLLLNTHKAGLGAAYLKGMAHAFNTLGADVVFEFDADLSHDPQKIPLFLEHISAGADMVLGSRYIAGGGIPPNWGLHRKFLSIVGNLVIMTVLTNFSIRDWTTGYRALTKEVYEAVSPLLQSERFTGYTFQIGFLYTAVKQGFSVVEVPFQFVDRSIGKSKLGPEYIKNTLLFIIKARLLDLLKWKFFKFVVVGGLGAIIQLLSLLFFRALLPPFSFGFISDFFVATFLSIEVAVISNFVFNNIWTFKEQKLEAQHIPRKFITFNLASGGSIGIQLVIAAVGKALFGLRPLFTLPVIGLVVDTGLLLAVTGIGVGMFWNFFAYTTFIWNKKAGSKVAQRRR